MSNGQQYESYILTNHAKDKIVSIKQEDNEQVEEVYGCQSRPSLVLNSDNQLQEHVKEEVIIKQELVENSKCTSEYCVDTDVLEAGDGKHFEKHLNYYVNEEFSVALGSESETVSKLSPKERNVDFNHGKKLSDSSGEKNSHYQKRTTGKDCAEEDLICNICGKKFTRKHSVQIHLRIHTGERPFECKECGACFKQSGDLKMHQTTHLGLKPYICEVCSIPFRRRGDMNRHMQVHSGMRPFKCKACGREFARASHLKFHLESKHGDTQQKTAQNGTRLMAPRERLKCSICMKSFKSERNLKEHNRIHTGDRPHKCDYCGKAFFHTGSFNIHTRIHTGERPYPCKLCKKTFICSSALGKHVRKSHGGS